MLDFVFIKDNWLFIATGIGATLGVTIFSFLLATPIAAIVAQSRRSTFLPIKALFSIFVLIIDRVPLYLQILFVFLALPQIGVNLPGFAAALMLMTIYYSSRLSDDFPSSFTTQGKFQDKPLFSVIPKIPQIINNMIKDSAMLSAGHFIQEVTERAMLLGRTKFKNLETLIIAAIIYFILITSIKLIAKVIINKNMTFQFGAEG